MTFTTAATVALLVWVACPWARAQALQAAFRAGFAYSTEANDMAWYCAFSFAMARERVREASAGYLALLEKTFRPPSLLVLQEAQPGRGTEACQAAGHVPCPAGDYDL